MDKELIKQEVHPFSQALVFLVLAIYLSLFNTSYLPITEGWFSTYAKMIDSGRILYKDINFLFPPLYPYVVLLLQKTFGEAFIVLRLFGVVVYGLIGVYLYKILELIPMISNTVAITSALVGMIYYSTGVAFISYDFTQVMTLIMVASSYYLLFSISNPLDNDPSLKISSYLVTSGLLCAASLMVKQSNPAFLFFAHLVIILTGLQRGHVVKSLLLYLFGFSIPLALLASYLIFNSSYISFIDQVFYSAVQAKGTFSSILLGWVSRESTHIFGVVPLTYVSLTISFLFIDRYFFNRLPLLRCFSLSGIPGFYLSILAISLVLFLYLANLNTELSNIFLPSKVFLLLYQDFDRSLVLFLIIISSFYPFWSRKVELKVFNLLRSSTFISFGLILGNSTSAGISEISTFLPLAFILAYILSCSSINLSSVLYLLILGGVSFSIQKKIDMPYYWWGVTEPTLRSERAVSDNHLFNGLNLAKNTVEIYSSIQQYKNDLKAEDVVYSSPSIPIVNLILDKLPVNHSVVHWFDFLDDENALVEIQWLAVNKPKMVFFLQYPETTYIAHEFLFRHGSSSGLRKLKEYILSEIKKMNYVVDKTIPVSDGISLLVLRRST